MRGRALVAAMLWVAIQLAAAGAPDPDAPSKEQIADSAALRVTATSAVDRGRYLVRHVAMCVECHTPRRADGSLDVDQLFAGAIVPVKSPYPARPWADHAPLLAGLPGGWSEEQLVEFLQTGKTPNDHAPRPPMPAYRLQERDATSIAAYLASIQSAP